MNTEQAKMLHQLIGREYAEVKDGKVTNMVTGKVIPVKHIAYGKIPEDGVYCLSEATCGGSMASNKEPTVENLEKYQCRVGRRAPLCSMYSKNKCAVYGLFPYEKQSVSIDVQKLMELFPC